ncbi:hypothetical protein KP509_37G010700 [Ceratopteris richardii]|uniref:FAD/NAD(P)-binding domain-containing protein n=1 Tax=Ceratopteris richardii TaxID=49495 RepID=A0A8T2Q6E9_CERRI|nr:hypothetical protein KP509_37G010700 [Ceratopteris richardii]
MRKRVVVVGGGLAGALSAKLLEDHCDVTLLDPKDYMEVPYARLRSIVEPDITERSLVPHADYLKRANHLLGYAKDVSDKAVVTSTNEELPYDYLIIATGSTYDGPSTKAERIQEFHAENQKLRDAKKVLVIGGGPVGVELTGEIVVDFPEKKVVLAHGGDRLIEFVGPKASKKAFEWLEQHNVDIRLQERINLDKFSSPSHVYTTSSGASIEADCHFMCVGKKIGASWMKSTFLSEKQDKDGRLGVDNFLRVKGRSNIFAAGDITAVKEIKQGYLAGKHAQVVSNNVKRLIANPSSKLCAYKPLATPMALISLGRRIAVAQVPIGTFLGRIPGMIKIRNWHL